MKKQKIFPLLCIMVLLCGCSPSHTEKSQVPDGQIQIGRTISVESPEKLTLFEKNDALAADGLYYATWVDGDSVPYQNSDGETVDLYDAQLYFLANECANAKNAEENYNAWLDTAKDNYHISSEKEITCNDQLYTIISYTCASETNPYHHGISAFSVCGSDAVCIELTCVAGYTEELEPILINFLNGCHFDNN